MVYIAKKVYKGDFDTILFCIQSIASYKCTTLHYNHYNILHETNKIHFDQ